jgi:hypothetical protein
MNSTSSFTFATALPQDRPNGHQAGTLRFALLGEGLALAGAIERLRQSGHRIVGVVACAEGEGDSRPGM